MFLKLSSAVALAAAACGSPPSPSHPNPDSNPAPTASAPKARPSVTSVAVRTSAQGAPVVLPPGAIGTAHPTLFEGASPSMNWTLLCQAREDTDGDGKIRITLSAHGELRGDQPQRYLIEGDGPGIAIDALAGADPSGRHVAWIRDDRLILRDTVSKSQVDLSTLGADTRRDQSSYSPHRAVSFSPAGSHILYLRQHGERQWIVERDLVSGAETVHSPGAGQVWRIAYEPDGKFVSVQVVLADSNGNRRIEWPYPEDDSASPSCAGPIPYYNVWEFPGDTPHQRLLRLSDSKLIDPKGFVITYDSAFVTRNEDQELWLNLDTGESRIISSKECSARVLHADPKRDVILVGCAGAYGARRDVFLWSSKARRKLGFDLAAFEVDERDQRQPRLLGLYPRNEARLLDLDTQVVLELAPNDEVLASFADHALLQRGRSLFFLELTRTEQNRVSMNLRPAQSRRAPLAQIQQQDALVSIDTQLFNLENQVRVGSFTEVPLALARGGHGLIFASRRVVAPQTTVRKGPLKWARPSTE